MPSPIAHAAVGYAIYRVAKTRRPQETRHGPSPLPVVLLFTLAMSVAPDLDFVPGLLIGHLDRFHNTISNSLFMGLVVSTAVATLIRLVWRRPFLFWFALSLLCYEAHVIMDYFTLGRGVMLLWPFSGERFRPAVNLFYGLHRSDGWISIRHVWTLLTETAFVVILLLALRAVECLQFMRRSNTDR